MNLPKGVDANPYSLTELRELVLRYFATDNGVELDRPVTELWMREQDIREAERWLRTHDYLDGHTLTNRGRQVAQHLSRADRHDPIFDTTSVPAPAQQGRPVPGTRVRCSCGWGGARHEQGPAELKVPYPQHRGGQVEAGKLHAAHGHEKAGTKARAVPTTRRGFDALPGGGVVDEEPW